MNARFRNPKNLYDREDRVERGSYLRAHPLTISKFRVREPWTDTWSAWQVHAIFDNAVLAVMSEPDALIYADFIVTTREIAAGFDFGDFSSGNLSNPDILMFRECLHDDLHFYAFLTRDFETKEWSPLQFLMQNRDTIPSVMGDQAAKLFASFVNDELKMNKGETND